MKVSLRRQFAKINVSRQARAMLTPNQEQAVELFVEQGYGIRESARVIGISHASVQRRLKRALHKLGGDGDGEGSRETVRMPTEDIAALEEQGEVMAVL